MRTPGCRWTALFLLLILTSGIVAAEDSLKGRIDSLFAIASSLEFRYRDLVGPAQDSIAAMSTTAVPHLIDRLGTPIAHERAALESIFRKIGRPAVPLLNQALLTTDSLQLSRVALVLGNLPDTSSVVNLLRVTQKPYYWVRYESIRALGLIRDVRAVPAVRTALADTNELVRTIAAVAAGHLRDTSLIDALIAVLDDPYYGVRLSAKESLAGFSCGQKGAVLFAALAQSRSPLHRRYLISIPADDTCRYPLEKLTPFVDDPDPIVRSLALRAAARTDPKATAARLAGMPRDGQGQLLKQTIDDLSDHEAATPAHP
ncbi:MAG: HEAT repeat domain-containing protein [candidate division Zixibacteria bacterium]|nr:HEAT repeat domain-containing protein [candidate division Zixibacteria bacterium]